MRRPGRILHTLTALSLLGAAGTRAADPPPRVSAKVEQSQRVKIDGGDFDDKLQRMVFDITISNQSLSKACEGLTFEFYMVGQAVTQPSKLTLLQKERQEFSLEPRGSFTAATPEVQLKWDTTGAAFGDKYRGWVLRVLDASGQQILQQASSSFLTDTTNLPNLPVGASFDKQGKPMGGNRP